MGTLIEVIYFNFWTSWKCHGRDTYLTRLNTLRYLDMTCCVSLYLIIAMLWSYQLTIASSTSEKLRIMWK
jgi:hypothetical protein